ncbi:CBS domain-containing protein [Halorubrum sp. CBA1125]|uniref:CBS domain-containing protein n=1 Tax=Halorubrum sp. CBA1125 TaxID=2668072 RepID=UPI0012E8E5D8|nr:CBS domain-containing protein [Halorubrum sp. CBA1125]MUW14231.1 CBS domain-containing protein [Halorubrum sp. CBA1125]
MFGEEFTIGVRDLMTTEIYYLSSEYTVNEALVDLQEKQFNAAPIKGNTSPYHYVRRKRLESLYTDGFGSDDLLDHASQIDLDSLISPDTDFEELIELLEEKTVYFIGWNDRLEGIITQADLNKLASHTYLYSKINQIETYLRDVIHPTTSAQVIEENSEEARSKYEDDGDADLQLRLVDYTTFEDLYEIVKHHRSSEGNNPISQQLPFDQENAVRILYKIKELRNDVAHHGNTIHIMGIDQSTEDNRDIRDLRRIYDNMNKILEYSR